VDNPRIDLWLAVALALTLGVTVRLIGIDSPITDGQAWRQCDSAAIARNFFEEHFSVIRPRVDWRGNTPDREP
jgi:hypothetical protein